MHGATLVSFAYVSTREAVLCKGSFQKQNLTLTFNHIETVFCAIRSYGNNTVVLYHRTSVVVYQSYHLCEIRIHIC